MGYTLSINYLYWPVPAVQVDSRQHPALERETATISDPRLALHTMCLAMERRPCVAVLASPTRGLCITPCRIRVGTLPIIPSTRPLIPLLAQDAGPQRV